MVTSQFLRQQKNLMRKAAEEIKRLRGERDRAVASLSLVDRMLGAIEGRQTQSQGFGAEDTAEYELKHNAEALDKEAAFLEMTNAGSDK